MSSNAMLSQLSTMDSRVTLTVRVQYVDYHPHPPLSEYLWTLTVRVQYMEYHLPFPLSEYPRKSE